MGFRLLESPLTISLLCIYSQIDFRGKLWTCAICLGRNQLPPHYSDISPNQLPPELMQEYMSIEYVLNKQPSNPPIFLYVVDTCLRDEDLKALKDSLIVSLNLLPPHALVGLITYGTMVYLYFYSLLLADQPHASCTSRLKFMKLDSRNALNHMCLEEAKSTRESKYRKCWGFQELACNGL